MPRQSFVVASRCGTGTMGGDLLLVPVFGVWKYVESSHPPLSCTIKQLGAMYGAIGVNY